MNGMLKSSYKVHCTICGCSHTRSASVIVENTPESIAAGKKELTEKLTKSYTCRICSSILKS